MSAIEVGQKGLAWSRAPVGSLLAAGPCLSASSLALAVERWLYLRAGAGGDISKQLAAAEPSTSTFGTTTSSAPRNLVGRQRCGRRPRRLDAGPPALRPAETRGPPKKAMQSAAAPRAGAGLERRARLTWPPWATTAPVRRVVRHRRGRQSTPFEEAWPRPRQAQAAPPPQRPEVRLPGGHGEHRRRPLGRDRGPAILVAPARGPRCLQTTLQRQVRLALLFRGPEVLSKPRCSRISPTAAPGPAPSPRVPRRSSMGGA